MDIVPCIQWCNIRLLCLCFFTPLATNLVVNLFWQHRYIYIFYHFVNTSTTGNLKSCIVMGADDLASQEPRGCFTNVLRGLQNNLTKIHNARYRMYGENFKLKHCSCAQSMALGTRTKFQLEILITITISTIHKFRECLGKPASINESTPRPSTSMILILLQHKEC